MTGQDWIVACVVATEVPPKPTGNFTAPMIPLAIRAVCDVIRNRVGDARFGDNAVSVVLQPKQFSAVCREPYWRDAMAGKWFPHHVQQCLEVWQDNPTGNVVPGAKWYYSPISMVPRWSEPSWVKGLTEVTVEGLDTAYFRFYRE